MILGSAIFNGKTPAQDQLINAVRAAIPDNLEIVAANFARTTHSSYWLLKSKSSIPNWLTLRLATHPLWLKEAQQLEVLWDKGSGDYFDLSQKINQRRIQFQRFSFLLSPIDTAVLNLLVEFEKHDLVLMVQLPEHLSDTHKEIPMNLQTDFPKFHLLLSDRNNVNKLHLPINNPKFQQPLALYYGRNFLFSQFTAHHLMKLLPTNQWLQPILNAQPVTDDWQQLITYEYGPEIIYAWKQAVKIQKEGEAFGQTVNQN